MYQALAQTLKWSEYFKLLKGLLFKLGRLTRKASLSGSDTYSDEDIAAQEKVVTKCICRVLNGFHFKEVPDVMDQYMALAHHDQLHNGESDVIGDAFEQVLKLGDSEEEESEVEEVVEMMVIE